MFGFRFRSAHLRKRFDRSKRLRIEVLEDRRMLVMADIVFLVDSSLSGLNLSTHAWLKSIVDELDGTLRSAVNMELKGTGIIS
jgi:hypothetical protein